MADLPYPFSPEIQAEIVRLLLSDPRFISRAAPCLKPARLSNLQALQLATHALAYYQARGKQGTGVEILQQLRLQVDAGKVTFDQLTQCTEYLNTLSTATPADYAYVLDLIFQAERKAAMWVSLDQGLNRYKTGTQEAYDSIVQDVTKAAAIGTTDSDPGIDHFATLDARSAVRASGKVVKRYGTGIVDLDEALLGGLAAGELGAVVAPAKIGKTATARQIALYTASQGGIALFLSLEMSEAALTDQNDATVSGIPITDLVRSHYLVNQRVKAWYQQNGGQVVTKFMRPYETTAKSIRAQLQQYKIEHNLTPTVLLVDYAGRMSASKRSDKRYDEIGYVYSELRDLAVEFQIPVWTGHQMNRAGYDMQNPTLANLGESIKPAAEADVLIAVCRTEEEIVARQVRFSILASRFSPGGIQIGPLGSGLESGRIVAHGTGLHHVG